MFRLTPDLCTITILCLKLVRNVCGKEPLRKDKRIAHNRNGMRQRAKKYAKYYVTDCFVSSFVVDENCFVGLIRLNLSP